MVNNIDDWLNSLGLDEEPQHIIETSIIQAPEPPAEPQQPTTQELSENDFDDILQGLGFNEVQEAEVVEDEEEHLNQEEPSNDAEALQMEYIANRIVAAGSNPYSTRVLNIPAPTEEELMQAYRDSLHVRQQIIDAIDDTLAVGESPVSSTGLDSTPPALAPLIEPNSPTLLMNDATSRFSGTEWFNEIQKQKVIIAGMGGIGSNLAFQVARMNPEAMFLYDNDTVETVNMSGQLFSRNDVGRTKVDAVAEKISSFTTTQHVYALNERYTTVSERGDIMMCGFDNMAARKVFFEAWLGYIESKSEEEKKHCLFLDGRLSIDTLQIFCITGNDIYNIKRYAEKHLFSDSEADETVCSMKQTTYLACMIGSLMTNLFTNFVANLLDPIIPYDLPFFTEYDAQNMIFKTEN